jgi:IclR family transcriptional regulator, KDG regulon repressor
VEQERTIDALTFMKFTPTTISDAVRFRKELRSVREQGFAVDRGETAEDITSTAAPILDYSGKVAAVITVSTETSLATPARLARMVQYLTERTAFISRQIGYNEHAIS